MTVRESEDVPGNQFAGTPPAEAQAQLPGEDGF